MQYIYIDESGDLGFDFRKKKTSKHFIITTIVTKDKDIMDRSVKKIFKSLSKRELKNHSGTFHAFFESDSTRYRLLEIFQQDISSTVGTIIINKYKVSDPLKKDKHKLYSLLIWKLIDNLCASGIVDPKSDLMIFTSRRETNKFLNKNFSLTIKDQFRDKYNINLDLRIESSSKEKGLQMVDMISWSIFRNFEYRDDTYYKLIQEKIKSKTTNAI